jgi:hypothetical protein
MQEAGRKVWNKTDHAAACKAYARLSRIAHPARCGR